MGYSRYAMVSQFSLLLLSMYCCFLFWNVASKLLEMLMLQTWGADSQVVRKTCVYGTDWQLCFIATDNALRTVLWRMTKHQWYNCIVSKKLQYSNTFNIQRYFLCPWLEASRYEHMSVWNRFKSMLYHYSRRLGNFLWGIMKQP